MKVKTIARWSLLLAGIIIGWWHLKLGVRAGFVARNDEPQSFWFFLFTGPLSTLPASIVAFFRPFVGAVWLCSGALVCYIFAMASLGPEGYGAAAGRNFIRYSAPMLALGLAAFFIAGLDKSSLAGEDKESNPAISHSEEQDGK